jgi:hypothetical protein
VQSSFVHGFHVACIVAAAICAAGAAGALLLPGRAPQGDVVAATAEAELVPA